MHKRFGRQAVLWGLLLAILWTAILPVVAEEPEFGGEVGSRLMYEGDCGDTARWELYANGELWLRGTGAVSEGTPGWYDYREQVRVLCVTSGITEIGAGAGDGCTELTQICYEGSYPRWCKVVLGDSSLEALPVVFPNCGGWVAENGTWYFYDAAHQPVKNRWMQDSIGWVWLGEDGAMAKNAWLTDSNGLCYAGPDGYCLTNTWKEHEKGWVYFCDTGSVVKNKWMKQDGRWRYLGEEGFAVTECWQQDSLGWIWLDEEGFMTYDRWITWEGGVSYCDPTGYRVTGTVQIGEETYTFDDSGILQEEKPAEKAFVKQPESVTAETGSYVQFHVEVTGDVVSYRWEYRKIYKFFNTSMEGCDTDTLTVPATGARNGYGYRCVVTFADGTELVSEVAKLTVNTYITDVQNPNDQTVVLGYKGQFTAAATGEGLKYQWEYKRPDGEKWIETAMEGANKPTVLIETTTARDGYRYRCRITDVAGVVTYTEPATMRVLSFKGHPQEAFAATDSQAIFTVDTSVEDGFTYQWQYRRSSTGNWTNTTMTGYNTDTLTVPAKGKNGYEYRCVLTGSKNSKIESKGAILHVGDPVVINSQTEFVTVAADEVATFTVDASNAYSYQWYYQRPNGTTWTKTSADGNATATLNVTTKATNNGYKYRCEIKGLDGELYYTEPATLTVQ